MTPEKTQILIFIIHHGSSDLRYFVLVLDSLMFSTFTYGYKSKPSKQAKQRTQRRQRKQAKRTKLSKPGKPSKPSKASKPSARS